MSWLGNLLGSGSEKPVDYEQPQATYSEQPQGQITKGSCANCGREIFVGWACLCGQCDSRIHRSVERTKRTM